MTFAGGGALHWKTEKNVRWTSVRIPKHTARGHLPRVRRAPHIRAAHRKGRIVGKGHAYEVLGSELNTALVLQVAHLGLFQVFLPCSKAFLINFHSCSETCLGLFFCFAPQLNSFFWRGKNEGYCRPIRIHYRQLRYMPPTTGGPWWTCSPTKMKLLVKQLKLTISELWRMTKPLTRWKIIYPIETTELQ